MSRRVGIHGIKRTWEVVMGADLSANRLKFGVGRPPFATLGLEPVAIEGIEHDQDGFHWLGQDSFSAIEGLSEAAFQKTMPTTTMAITNTTILLTGASRGIGKSLAQSLARQGARVALTARNQETLEKTCEEIRSAGGEAKGYVADAADTARAAEVIKAVEADLGPIDTLINNAGLRGVMGDFWENDLEACWETLTVNILGPMAYAHAASPRMIERGSGCIINMGSYAGVIPLALNASYSASKAALARFGDCLAESLRKHGVHVFTVSPGMVKTDMTSGPELRVLFPNAEWTPMEKIEALVTNLLTRDAAALTGTFIHANDDFDRLLGAADRINEEALYTLRLPTLDGLV